MAATADQGLGHPVGVNVMYPSTGNSSVNSHQRETITYVEAQLPPYEPPPPWIPPLQRKGHRDYDNDIRQFLPKRFILRRKKASDQLGFNIRGGKEHHCGIYISKVTPNSEAERLGMREGHQILAVNDISFESVDHSEAVRILKMNTDVQLTVRFFPYGYDRTYDKSRYHASVQSQSQNR